MTTPPGKSPVNVHCTVDNHTWTALYTPMEMGTAGRVLKNVRCPLCGAPPSKIVMATSEDINHA